MNTLWRGHLPPQSARRDRIAGALLTGVLYAGVVFTLWWSFNHIPAPVRAITEITAQLLLPEKKREPEPPPVLKVLKLRAENPSPPNIIIAPSPAPSQTAVAAQPPGGTTLGNGAGIGSGGNGNGAGGGCLDAVWMRAVSERVRQFFYYPPAALAIRKTGLVMVHFAVARDGTIEKLQIGRSSGDAGLDKAALDIVQKAQPLPPIPERMRAERVEGELPVNFGVRSFNGSSTNGTCN
jgi:protein TonB